MYVTLEVSLQLYGYRGEYHKIDLSNLPKSDFMPTKLVRIYDMAVVDGSDVNEGYCALSYSWNQSGEILCDEATGKYKIIDEGKHEIVTYDNMFPEMIIPENKRYSCRETNTIYKVLQIMDKNNYFFTKKIKYVKFEGIIQKICQLFNIKYIWYDQMCINQDNREEKQREIRNMHHIYSNAHCTIALVPDYKDNITLLGTNREEYFKRLWTLEEAIKSKRLLFVGRDVHKRSENFARGYGNISILNTPLSKISVSQILYHAHRRTSTKAHDRVFALIHLFPEFMQHINIDYNQPFEDLMIRFYDLLAKKDLSILLFRKTIQESTIQKYKFLPSWTGVNGMHKPDNRTTSFRNYDIIGKTMNVTSKFVTNFQPIDNDALTIRKEDLPPPPGDINDGENKRFYYLCITAQLPGTSDTRNVSLRYSFSHIVKKEEPLNEISKILKRLSKFMETKKENLYWCHVDREEYQKVIRIHFDDLTEDADDPLAQYIILSEVSFNHKYGPFYYPVIKKKQGEEYWKAIGCCCIISKKDIFSDCNLPKQTFLIQ